MLAGLWVNLQVLVIGAVLVAVFGLGIALLRTLRGPIFAPLRIVATIYVDVFRGIPLIVVLYLVGFGIPALRLRGRPDVGLRARHGGGGAHVLRVRRGGVPGRHRVGPPQPGRGGPVARV